MTAYAKERIIHYLLVTLMVGFFVIPLATLCWVDCKTFASQRIASILLFFFR